MRLGLIKTTKEALTPQQKVLAAQALIYKQTKDAQGDFARTSDGLANKQRILSAQFANVQAQIGQKLLPVALKLATFASERLIPALTRLGQRLEGPVSEAFARVSAFMRDDFLPVAERVFGWLAENVPPVLERIGAFIAGVSRMALHPMPTDAVPLPVHQIIQQLPQLDILDGLLA